MTSDVLTADNIQQALQRWADAVSYEGRTQLSISEMETKPRIEIVAHFSNTDGAADMQILSAGDKFRIRGYASDFDMSAGQALQNLRTLGASVHKTEASSPIFEFEMTSQLLTKVLDYVNATERAQIVETQQRLGNKKTPIVGLGE